MQRATPDAIPVYSAAYVDHAVDALAAMSRVIARGHYVLGSEVEQFERAFADYCGVGECVTVANGTDALELALKAVGVGPGSNVALVANAGYYGTTALLALGANPRYVDVDDETLTMSVGALSEAVGEPLDAVLVTHLYGRLAAIEALLDVARAAGLPLIEDCAQAHGATRGGRRAGSFGTAACFSFYPTKNLPAVGDAGAVVTSDPAVARRVRTLRQYGWAAKYHVETAGGRNSRMDEIQAAVLNDRLPRLDDWNAQRRSIAERYVTAFAAHPVALPRLGEDYVPHLFVLRTDLRDEFRRSLFADGVATDVHYPVPDHRQPSNPQPATSLPVTERACQEVATLPCYPGMTSAQIERVIGAVDRNFAAVRADTIRAEH